MEHSNFGTSYKTFSEIISLIAGLLIVFYPKKLVEKQRNFALKHSEFLYRRMTQRSLSETAMFARILGIIVVIVALIKLLKIY